MLVRQASKCEGTFGSFLNHIICGFIFPPYMSGIFLPCGILYQLRPLAILSEYVRRVVDARRLCVGWPVTQAA